MRKNVNYFDSKVITFSIIGVLLLATIVFSILMYGNNVNKNVRDSQLSPEKIASISERKEIKEDEENLERVSSSIGKSVEEQENKELNNNEEIKEEKKEVNAEETKKIETQDANKTKIENLTKTDTKTDAKTQVSAKPVEVKKELEFQKPVEGEIIREFAKDNLVFSKTLSEWVTHFGIDIKADKATVVQAAEDGIVKTIKNDPRYGLTIVINHGEGLETVYANLLSSEFVKEGEKVKKGQSIGTVGNTGTFESADEPHLHFEILKDSVSVDPNIYLK